MFKYPYRGVLESRTTVILPYLYRYKYRYKYRYGTGTVLVPLLVKGYPYKYSTGGRRIYGATGRASGTPRKRTRVDDDDGFRSFLTKL